MRVLVSHCYADSNKGDAAIIISTLQLIRRYLPSAHVTLQSLFSRADPRYTHEHRFSSPFADQVCPSLFPAPCAGTRPLETMLCTVDAVHHLLRSLLLLLYPHDGILSRLLLRRNDRRDFQAFRSADLIVVKGGGYLYSRRGIRGLLFSYRMLWPILLATRLKRRTLLLGHTLGPFASTLSTALFRLALRSPRVQVYRERYSVEIAANLGVEKDRILVAPDVALALSDPVRAERSPIASGRPGISSVPRLRGLPGRFVGVTARPWSLDRYSPTVAKNTPYTEALVTVVCYLANTFKVRCVLFPQCIGPSPYEDDRPTLLAIAKRCQHLGPNAPLVLTDDFSPFELKTLYESAYAFIATRLHSAILALSGGVPTCAIAYESTKALGTYRLLGLRPDPIAIDHPALAEYLRDFVKQTLCMEPEMYASLREEIRAAIKASAQAVDAAFESSIAILNLSHRPC